MVDEGIGSYGNWRSRRAAYVRKGGREPEVSLRAAAVAGANAVRSRIASVVWLVAVVCAVVGMFKFDPNARACVTRTRLAQQHLPAHPQVHHKCLILGSQWQPKELAAPRRMLQDAAGEPVDEVFGRTGVAPQRPLVIDRDCGHRRSGDGRREAPAHHLDLWQFRQR